MVLGTDSGSVRSWTKQRVILSILAVSWIALFLVIPLIAIFAGALSSGVLVYLESLVSKEAIQSMLLTL
ncbi:MAG: hypothetical protein ACRC5C_08575, partial [Bacilli bacterium]